MPLRASTKHRPPPDDGPQKKKPPSRAALKAIQTAQHFDHLADSANVDVHVVALIRDRSIASTWRDVAKGLIPAPRKFGSATKWNVGELRRTLK